MTLSYEEIETLTGFNQKESTHFMPNEIFEDLQGNLSKSPHIAFAYSYYYLISWLYRNAKYGTKNINTADMKQLLGYSKTNKTINYLIKHKGVLDLMGYTETTNNYPWAWEMDEFNDPVFSLIDDEDEQTKKEIHKGKDNNYKIKYPIKHFYRDSEDIEDDHTSGVFYDISNTHMVGFDVFIHCMSLKELGATGFYLYGYLKMQNQKFDGGYDVSLENLEEETGIPYVSLNRYMDALKKYKLIDTIHNQKYFAKGMDDEDRKANTYITNESDFFTFTAQPYKKMEVKTFTEHMAIQTKKKAKQDKKNQSERVEISLSELPF